MLEDPDEISHKQNPSQMHLMDSWLTSYSPLKMLLAMRGGQC